MSLDVLPERGRKRRDSAYQLYVHPWPYLILYEILGDRVIIEGIRHTSQDTMFRS